MTCPSALIEGLRGSEVTKMFHAAQLEWLRRNGMSLNTIVENLAEAAGVINIRDGAQNILDTTPSGCHDRQLAYLLQIYVGVLDDDVDTPAMRGKIVNQHGDVLFGLTRFAEEIIYDETFMKDALKHTPLAKRYAKWCKERKSHAHVAGPR